MIKNKWKKKWMQFGAMSLAAMMLAGSMSISSLGVLTAEAAGKKATSTASSNSVNQEENTTQNVTSNNDEEEDNSVSSTSEFLIVGDCAPTVTGRYGQPVHLILPIYNMGVETVTNLVVTPVISNKAEEWPFQINTTGLVQAVDYVPASPNKDIAYQNRREVEWDLVVRKDALTGYYPLDFNVTYYRQGSIESTTLRMYVYIEGSKDAGMLETSDSEKLSNPRIIVTGFATEPEEVYAGSTFKLIIHLQNTAANTAVSNIMFELEAAQEGLDENATYAAFLPTSGSSTIFKDSIPAGATTDIEIEMTAKADLAQKPYILDIKMDYEDSQKNSYTAASNVSIPVKQVAKYDLSSFEVMPSSISVGEESNVMFSLYNTGKTTLYNVKVTFEAESVTGGDTFVGKVEPGGTGNIDAMITGSQMTEDDGKVKVIISYEDEAGNVTTDEKELELFVTEEMMDEDMMMDDMMMLEEESGGGSKVGKIILIIVIVVVVAVVGLIVFLKIKKKKKAEKELADDLDDLLNDIEEEKKEAENK